MESIQFYEQAILNTVDYKGRNVLDWARILDRKNILNILFQKLTADRKSHVRYKILYGQLTSEEVDNLNKESLINEFFNAIRYCSFEIIKKWIGKLQDNGLLNDETIILSLKHAAQYGHQDIFKLFYDQMIEMIKNNSNFDHKKLIQEVFCIAAHFGHYTIVSFLLNKGISSHLFLESTAKAGQFGMMDLLIRNGIEWHEDRHITPIYHAQTHGHGSAANIELISDLKIKANIIKELKQILQRSPALKKNDSLLQRTRVLYQWYSNQYWFLFHIFSNKPVAKKMLKEISDKKDAEFTKDTFLETINRLPTAVNKIGHFNVIKEFLLEEFIQNALLKTEQQAPTPEQSCQVITYQNT